MKIICDKCNSEFSFKGDVSGKNIYMVKCPVCKNPITVRVDSYHIAQKRNESNKISTKDNNIFDNDVHIDSDAINNKVHSSKHIKTDISIQQDMIDQIENGSDSITDTSDEIYYDITLKGINSKEKSDSIHGFGEFIKSMEPFLIIERYAPYIYYAFTMFIVFTILFLSSDFIRLDHISSSINPWLNSILYVFKHYV